MADVFLSYAREDSEAATAVSRDLQAEGFTVFFDTHISVGESWDAIVEKELGQAQAVVVLWSPQSCDSSWVRREAREAQGRLCPATIERCKIPLEFSDRQAANLVDRAIGDRSHAQWRHLIDSGVARRVGRTAPAGGIVTPGGGLPVHATNYVKRAADAEIDDILISSRSPATIVVGPINGGTSSFLNRVYHRARMMPSAWVSAVHFETEFTQIGKFTQLDLFRHLFRRIGIPGEQFLKDDLDVYDMKNAFDIWARRTWQNYSHVVLIVDGLDEVFKNAGSLADPLALVNWLSSLRIEASLGNPPYSKLALFTALTGETWSAAHGSPYASQASLLHLAKFTTAEVASMFSQLSIKNENYSLQAVYELFHGHPYLTQLFAWALRAGQSEYQARDSALNLDGHYETHWERVKSEIRFLIGSNYRLETVLGALTKVANRSIGTPLNDDTTEIWRAYRRALRVFGLVDGTAAQPTMCLFYKNAINRELGRDD